MAPASPGSRTAPHLARLAGLVLGGLAFTAMALAGPPYDPGRPANAAPEDLSGAVADRIVDALDAGHVVAKPVDPDAIGVLDRVSTTLTGLLGGKSRWMFALRPALRTAPDDPTTPGIRALPTQGGSKVVVDARILPTLGSEAALVFALAHHIGHLRGAHMDVRLTERMGVLGGIPGLQAWLAGDVTFGTDEQSRIADAFVLGAGAAPFSDAHEAEAMAAALMLGAEAGYAPAEAVPVLDRLAARQGLLHGAQHPDSTARREAVDKWIDKARKRYERNRQPGAARARASVWGDPGLADGG